MSGYWRIQLERKGAIATIVLLTGALHVVLYASQRLLYDPVTRRPALITWWIATVALFCLSAAIVSRCRDGVPPRRFIVMLWLTPFAVQLGWLFTTPVLSIDLLSYLADSLSVRAGLNPYTHAPSEWGGTAAGIELSRYGWRPTHGVAPYGPLWMLFMSALGSAGIELRLGMLIVKAVMLAANAASALLIGLILREVRPKAQLFGVMAFWWNPIVLEGAAEGHNDPLMTVFVLLGLCFTLRRRYATGALSLMCGVLTKYLPAVFVPAFLLYRWRTEANGRERLIGIASTLVVAAMMSVVLVAPFWAGWETFAGVFAGMQRKVTPGMSGALFAMMVNFVAPREAGLFTSALLSLALLITVVVTARTVRDGGTLVTACATISLVYVLVASPRFWPWYVMLPTALLCATGTLEAVLLAWVLTLCSRLIAPVNVIHAGNAISWPVEIWMSTTIGVCIPAVCWLVFRGLSRRRVTS